MSADVSDLKEADLEWIDAGCSEAMAGWGDELDVPIDTGYLASTQQENVLVAGWEWLGELAFLADYASYTDEGSEPHEIYGSPYLAFELDGDLVILLADRSPVHHPGSPGTHWFTDVVTADAWAERVEANLGDLG